MEYTEANTQEFLRLYRELEDIRDREPEKYRYYNARFGTEFESFRQLRNYLSHETFLRTDPVAVSDKIVARFKAIRGEMDLSASDVMTKRIDASAISEKLSGALSRMEEKAYSYLPILDERKRLLGIISLGDLIRIFVAEAKIPEGTVGDFLAYFSLSSKHNEAYGFLAREAPLYEARRFFSSISEEGSRYGILFVTEHGKKDEAVLGLIAPIDLLKSEAKGL